MKIPKLTARHYAYRAFNAHALQNDWDKLYINFVMPPECNDEDKESVQREMEKIGRAFEQKAQQIKPFLSDTMTHKQTGDRG